MGTPSTKPDLVPGSTSGGAGDFLFFSEQAEASDASLYLDLVRQRIDDPEFVVDSAKLRAAIVLACAAQIEHSDQVDTPSFAWLQDHESTHLDTLFPGVRDVTHEPATFPSSIGRFILVGTVGRGGFATVYSAVDVRYRRCIALKTLHAGTNSSDRPRRLMIREGNLLRQTNCAHVVRVYDIYEIGRETVIAMEMVDGGTLQSTLASKGRLSRYDAAEMARQVASGIGAAHRQQIIHRDLKPGNVLRDLEGRWCVADFGLAKQIDKTSSISSPNQIRGTKAYTSLEQLNKQDVTERTDIFAIGLLLFEAVTGKRAFDADGVQARKENILNQTGIGSRRNRRLLGPELYAIVKTCLQPYPEHRYESAERLQKDLASYLSGKPVSVRAPSAWNEFRYFVRRYKKTSALALAAGVAMFAMMAIYIDGSAKRKAGILLERQGTIASAVGDLPDLTANARDRALEKLSLVIAKHGVGDDLVSPYVAALLKPGFSTQWQLPGAPGLGFDVTDDGELAAIADPNAGVKIIPRGETDGPVIFQDAQQPSLFLAWSSTGRYLASMNRLAADAGRDDRRPFRVWDRQKEQQVAAIPLGIQDDGWGFAPDGRSIVVADAQLTRFAHYDLDSGRLLNHFPIAAGQWVRGMAVMHDGKSCAIAYANTRRVEVRDLASGKVVDQWEVSAEILDIDASATGELAVTSGHDVYVFKPGRSQAVGILHDHDAPVDRIRFSQRGDRLLSHCYRMRFKIWNVTDGKILLKHTSSRHVKFVNDDHEIAGLLNRDKQAGPQLVVSSLTQEVFRPSFAIPNSRGETRSMAFSDDATNLFVASNDGLVQWQMDADRVHPRIVHALPCGDVRCINGNLFTTHRFQVARWGFAKRDATGDDAVAITPLGSYVTPDHNYGNAMDVDASGQRIALLQPASNRVLVIDSRGQDGDANEFFDAKNARAIALSRDGTRLAISARAPESATRIWDLNTQEIVAVLPFVSARMRFASDPNLLLTGSASGYRTWDLARQDAIHTLPRPHSTSGLPLALTTNGEVMAVAIDHDAIALIHVASGGELLRIPASTVSIKQLRFSNSGNELAALNENGTIEVYRLDHLREQFESFGLPWPLPTSDALASAASPNAQSQRPSLPIANRFGPFIDTSWFPKAGVVGDLAAPLHREIESLTRRAVTDDDPLQACESLAHEMLQLGGLDSALKYFRIAKECEANPERIYFNGVLQCATGREEEFLRLRESVSDQSFQADGNSLALCRMCLLRPGISDLMLEKTLAAIDRQLQRAPDVQWLLTVQSLALVRAGKASEAVAVLRESCQDDWSSLDLFEKSVATLALAKDGDHELSTKLRSLCRRYPAHRFVDLRLYSEQLLAEADGVISANRQEL
ncbi:MAG: protein kinase [Pirellulaceae bacterium]|nr:protein kinase [Pirellulaceae bacterium]